MKIVERIKPGTGFYYYKDEPKLFMCYTQKTTAVEDGHKAHTIKYQKNCHIVSLKGDKICSFEECGQRDENGEKWINLKQCSVKCFEKFFVVEQTILQPNSNVEKDSYKAYTYHGRLFTCQPKLFTKNEQEKIERWLNFRDAERESGE